MGHRIKGTVIIPVEVEIDEVIEAGDFERATDIAMEKAIQLLHRETDYPLQTYNADWELYPEQDEEE